MNYRYMRILVMFDMPTETASQRREYRNFRKLLIKNGFFIMQESIYCKIALNATQIDSINAVLEKHKPNNGLIQILTITEKQYSKMKFLVGKSNTEVVSTDERVVFL